MKKFRAILAGVAIGISLIVIMAVSMFSCSPTRSLGSSPTDEATTTHVAQMLDNKLYKIDFTRAYPISARSFALTGGSYYISVIGDRVESFLPYYGRAYSIPYDGGRGLRFAAPITNYKVSVGKKGQSEISFDARTREDDYTFDLEVYPSGESYLTVSAMQRQNISFSGAIDLDPQFEAVLIP